MNNGANLSKQIKTYEPMMSYRHRSTASMGSFSPSKLDTNSLVVNNDPDVPLYVPLHFSSLEMSERVELMKQKNLNRFETAAKNLELLADKEKHDYLEKLKKKKKFIKSVEKNYEMERHFTKEIISKRRTKAEQILKQN